MEEWYVAHSKPRNEELLWKQFCLRNFEFYYPCINVQTVNPRARKDQPYFPGYLFVHVDLGLVGKSSIKWIPGGAGLVSFGNEPASVPDSLVFAIKQRIESLKMVSSENPIPFHKGDNVAVHDGVVKDMKGSLIIIFPGQIGFVFYCHSWKIG